MSVRSFPARTGRTVRAPKTAERIADHLRRRIVRGELGPGATLPPEVQLMQQFGVSRPTLREAFRILETETLIRVRRGAQGGAQVTDPELSVARRHVGLQLQMRGATTADVYEARSLHEPYCVRLVAERRTEGDLADLRACVDELQQAAAGAPASDPQRLARVIFRFHELLMERCGNAALAVQGQVLAGIAFQHLEQAATLGWAAQASPEPVHDALRAYRTLIHLVAERDGDGAETHWRSYMKACGEYLFRDESRSRPVLELFQTTSL